MRYADRVASFVRLGELLCQFSFGEKNSLMTKFTEAAEKAVEHNAWFTQEHITHALNSLGTLLRYENLSKWLDTYEITVETSPKKIGVVMAGNIPAVGFHDFLSVLITGNILKAKLASDDTFLIPAMASVLTTLDAEWERSIGFTQGRLEDFDAIIATGNNNSARYFDFYFGRYPNIIRRNRNSVAILTGNETEEQLKGLADDIFLYFGMGCRNISKIYIPRGYDPGRLAASFEKYGHFRNHNKYMNNYDYRKSLLIINKIPFIDHGFLLLTESREIPSPISVLHYETYSRIEEVTEFLSASKEALQCIVALPGAGLPAKLFGRAQEPELWDYADNIDTIKFLRSGIS